MGGGGFGCAVVLLNWAHVSSKRPGPTTFIIISYFCWRIRNPLTLTHLEYPLCSRSLEKVLFFISTSPIIMLIPIIILAVIFNYPKYKREFFFFLN